MDAILIVKRASERKQSCEQVGQILGAGFAADCKPRSLSAWSIGGSAFYDFAQFRR